MRIALLLLAAAISAGCQAGSRSAQAPPGSSAGSYFPLPSGATWERRADDGAAISARVVGQKTVGAGTCSIVETKTTRDDRTLVTRVCYEATPGEVRVLETETGGRVTVIAPPRIVLRLPPAAGQSWSWIPPGSVVPSSIAEEWVGEETVQVAAGSFKAWKVKSVTRRGDLTVTLFTWYARGVGIVKIGREEQRGQIRREGGSELVRYRVP